MFDCLVAGEANVDLLVEGATSLEVGKEKLATGMQLLLGGSSAITAFNLARLGRSVSFIGVVGQDYFGKFVEDKLATGPVHLQGLRKTDRAQTGMTIWHSKNGQRAGLTYPGTISMLRARDVSKEQLRGARHLHVGAYFLLSDFQAKAPRVFAEAKQLGLTTSVDCNYDPTERWDSHLQEVLKHIDVFLPNEQEARKLTNESKPVMAARKLAQSARVVVVKMGSKGAIVATGGQTFRVAAKAVKVVDTTGAGDSFNAGFLSKFLTGAKLETCVKAGVLAGARCVRKVGGTTAFEK